MAEQVDMCDDECSARCVLSGIQRTAATGWLPRCFVLGKERGLEGSARPLSGKHDVELEEVAISAEGLERLFAATGAQPGANPADCLIWHRAGLGGAAAAAPGRIGVARSPPLDP